MAGAYSTNIVLVAVKNDADRRVVALAVFLAGEVAKMHVHLFDVAVQYLVALEVGEHKAAQDAVIKDQIDLVVCVIERDAILPADEGEALAQFEEELLEVAAKHRFELRFRHLIRLAQQIGGLFDEQALCRTVAECRPCPC